MEGIQKFEEFLTGWFLLTSKISPLTSNFEVKKNIYLCTDCIYNIKWILIV